MDKINYLNDILRSFKIKATCVDHKKIRNIALYDIKLEPGTLVKVFEKFANEISLALKSRTKPLIRVIPHDGIVRMEIVEDLPEKIDFFSEIPKINKPGGKIPIWLGSSVDGGNIWMDMAKNPHMIIAGCTGSGKSVLLHTIIANALEVLNTVIYCIDTKNIEFGEYGSKLRNLTIVDTYKDGYSILEFLTSEMEKRYEYLKKTSHTDENKSNFSNILFVIDEYADLVSQDSNRQFSGSLCKLAQKCRAAGIYCILATQRPSADVISGSIKANFPARIACQVASGTDSKVVLDAGGAEKLIGSGDAIIKNYNNNYRRFQAAYTNPKDIIKKYAN